MLLTILIAVAASCFLGVLASVVMYHTSNLSPVMAMAVGASIVLAVAGVILAAILIAER